MVRIRRQHSAAQKAAALKKHHVDKVPVSDICEELSLQPSVFYMWQRQLFANADRAIGISKSATNPREKELQAKIAALETKNAALESKLTRKDAVIAEISEEHVRLKKELGEP
jgi:transposase-like protein